MGNPKINDRKLLQLIDKQGRSQSAAARELGVSRQAVSQRLMELRGKQTKVIAATRKIDRLTDQSIDVIDQLMKMNRYANEILDLLMRWQRGEPEALQILECQVKKIRVGKNEVIDVKSVRFKDPRELALKAMQEIRSQLKLQVEVSEKVFNIKEVALFQNVVISIVNECEPGLRQQIIDRFNAEREFDNAVKCTGGKSQRDW